jgi:hypothetical protein
MVITRACAGLGPGCPRGCPGLAGRLAKSACPDRLPQGCLAETRTEPRGAASVCDARVCDHAPPTTLRVVSLLQKLAVAPPGAGVGAVRYDSDRQVSQLWEAGRWVDSWEAKRLVGTKKFDRETGEDAKGQ